jgi:hypothetical protein
MESVSIRICSSKSDFKTTAPTPALANFSIESGVEVKSLLEAIIGDGNESPMYFTAMFVLIFIVFSIYSATNQFL